MAKTQTSDIAAVVLAGGQSSRMGQPKALASFGGEPLAARVMARLKPQAGMLFLNVRGEDPALAALGAPLVLDPPRWRGAGPLAGVAATLSRAQSEGFAFLATAPCDAPFLPLDLVARLITPVRAGAGAAVAVSAFGLEPMFALWPVAALEAVERALAAGRASPRSVLAELGAERVLFAEVVGTDPFANLNTPDEFAAAEAALVQDLLEADPPATARRNHGDPL